MKKITMLFVLLFITTSFIYADSFKVVSIGNDLNEQQKINMLNIFNVNENEAQIITVTNDEEKKYLYGIVSSSKIGNKAISCAYVEPLSEGSGLKVSTLNLTWVTDDIIANALTTAGIKDAKVIAAAPFNVSGTAALTGIMKGFEKATGKKLDVDAKNAANQEMVTTGELGQAFGKENAVQFINDVKRDVLKNNITSPDDIRTIIERVAEHNDINLSEEQIAKVIDLMNKINNLDLNFDEISNQLKDISGKISKVIQQNEEAKSILTKTVEMLKNLVSKLGRLFK
ncbi:DUF1002 domain-containing protein [Tepidibacter mesophilus]|uniref:DUF1002 domain-containing protein n=1 Tax=Tepidibacter mesophilus TaxID=655607 RepID=UPI0011AEC612|nr:DUF1002 domain-containing protein [Tepidibacter mesophilus]